MVLNPRASILSLAAKFSLFSYKESYLKNGNACISKGVSKAWIAKDMVPKTP